MCASISDKDTILKNIHIVLVSPQVPENIGLCARALKNTSFPNLVLVNPNLKSKSFEVAKRARDILVKAKVHADLKSALSDSHYVFATTRRKRKYKFIYNFKDILPLMVAIARKRSISIVFGRENFGLYKDEIDLCDSIFYIPANKAFPSYNLASAVGIVCYSIFEYIQNVLDIDYLDLAKKKDIESLFLFMRKTLEKVRTKKGIVDANLTSLKRIFFRTHLTKKEVSLLKTIFLAINKKL